MADIRYRDDGHRMGFTLVSIIGHLRVIVNSVWGPISLTFLLKEPILVCPWNLLQMFNIPNVCMYTWETKATSNHYNDIIWVLWRLKSWVAQQFANLLLPTTKDSENIGSPYYLSFVRELIDDQGSRLITWLWCGKHPDVIIHKLFSTTRERYLGVPCEKLKTKLFLFTSQ